MAPSATVCIIRSDGWLHFLNEARELLSPFSFNCFRIRRRKSVRKSTSHMILALVRHYDIFFCPRPTWYSATLTAPIRWPPSLLCARGTRGLHVQANVLNSLTTGQIEPNSSRCNRIENFWVMVLSESALRKSVLVLNSSVGFS